MTDPRVTGPRLNVRFALFALSANQCAFPGCDALMFSDGSILGEICHIHSQSPGGPRYRADLSSESVHGIENLILLCQKHHKIVDDHPYEYDAQRMKAMKEAQERGTAAATPSSMLHRLIEALAPEVPDDWWERPSAPVFRLSLASNRPPTGSWLFEVGLDQADGGDIGNLRYRYRLGEIEQDLKAPTFRERRKWRLDNIQIQPRGVSFELELRFWWDGGERSVTYRWEKESDFQTADSSIIHSSSLLKKS